MRDWFTAADILAVGSSALPTDMRALNRLIDRERWHADERRARPRTGRGGGFEYHLSLLPAEVQAKLIAQLKADQKSQDGTRAHALWDRFARLSSKAKSEAQNKLAIIDRVELLAAGMTRSAAVALAAGEAKVSTSIIWTWLRAADAVHRSDRLAALATRHAGRSKTAECHPQAWEFIKTDYLRPEQPAFDACYRRLLEAAAAQKDKWSIPSMKTLRRRLQKEVPNALRVMLRSGAEAAARTFPHQTRDRSVFHAMQAVTADGHTFDVFVRWEDGTIARPVVVAVQDLYSGQIVGHRLDRSENWSAVRLAFADAVGSFGIPEVAYLDNGRAFASKLISGRQPTRYRFKVLDDEPQGLLTKLGIRVSWVTPYHGQAKPIERAFRDFCEEIAKHPFCAGAYTGNSPAAKPDNYGAKALPIDAFETFVAQQIARHNMRSGRRTAVAKGRSFAETFRASYEQALIRKAAPGQLRELLLAAEERTCRAPDGSLYLGDNRYWSERLVEAIGHKVVIRFDPQSLFLPVAVYERDGRFICDAECIEQTGFNDIEASRLHAKKKQTYLRALREVRDLEVAMSIDEIARALPAPEIPQPPKPGVIRLIANGGATHRPAAAEPAETQWAGAESFERGVALLQQGSVLPFRKEEGGPA
jgi:transposase InsO family protein